MKIKICGITTMDDALASVEAGADMLGFNFYPPSSRYIEPSACAKLVAALRARGAPTTTVGVFVNMPPDRVAAILDECGLDLAQLSGDEPPSDLVVLGERAFKGIRPRDAAEALSLSTRYVMCAAPPALLVDASAGAGQFGGTGQVGDWDAAAAVAAAYPILLAGGLRPENVAAAVAAVQPWGVDVASGVESSPGRKDAAKMQAFVRAAREMRTGERESGSE
jgi:phosphoribosylanthranilate isomerase